MENVAERFGINEARPILGDLADAAAHGQDIILTRHGRAIARITAYQEDPMTSHYTAWLTTASSALDTACADVVVLADEETSPGQWTSTGDPLMQATTTVSARDGNPAEAIREAEQLLVAAGWRIVGNWDAVPTGYTVTVERS